MESMIYRESEHESMPNCGATFANDVRLTLVHKTTIFSACMTPGLVSKVACCMPNHVTINLHQ